MKQKIRGVIDPLTLGFLISFLGAGTVLVNEGDKQQDTVADTSPAVTMQAADAQSGNGSNPDVE